MLLARLLERPAVRNALGMHSPSREMLDRCTCRRCRRRLAAGIEHPAVLWQRGLVQGIADGQALIAAGLPIPPLSAEAIAHLELVVHRNFPSLYADEEDDV